MNTQKDEYEYSVEARDGDQVCSINGTTSNIGRKSFSLETNKTWLETL